MECGPLPPSIFRLSLESSGLGRGSVLGRRILRGMMVETILSSGLHGMWKPAVAGR